jgi:hypothetical protein
MKIVLHIFKKDLTKLKILLTVWCVLLVLYCVNGFSLFLNNYKMQLYLPDINALIAGLQFLMVVVIVPLLIQDDPLVGNSAFWLTRPISRKQLLTEKMAFLGLFLLVLPLCAEIFVLLSNGVNVRYISYLVPEFIYRQLKFIVPVLLVACLTQKFSKYALVGIVVLVVWYLVSLMTSLLPLFYNIEVTDFLKNSTLEQTDPRDISLEWSINLAKLLISALLYAFVIWNQFITRNAKRTIKLIVCSLIITAGVYKFWNIDFLNNAALKPNRLPGFESLQVVPDRDSVWTSEGYDFGSSNPDEKYQDIYIRQTIEGVPAGHFAMIDKLKHPTLTYADGTVLRWKDDIDGRTYAQINASRFFQPIQAVLSGTKIVNKYKKAGADSLFMKILDVNFGRYKTRAADYAADGQLSIHQYRVTSVLPLQIGASAWVGHNQYVIHDIIGTSFGIKLVIGERKVDLTLAGGAKEGRFPFSDFGFMRGMGHTQPLYILRNKRTGEAFVPEITQDAQISKPKFNDQAILKSRITQFLYAHENDRNFSLPRLDQAWLQDAEIWRLETQKVGYVNIPLAYDKILLDEKKDYIIKDGMRIYFFNTGEVKKEQPDVSGPQTAIVKVYYKTGDIKEAWAYANGELNGVSKTYYQDGTLRAEWRYKNGALNGISKSYFQSGELFYTYTYVDGELHGESKKYNQAGDVIATKTFDKGELAID